MDVANTKAPYRFFLVACLSAAVGLTASGCGGMGEADEGETTDEKNSALTPRCTQIYTQTGESCDYFSEYDPVYGPGPPTCTPEYDYITVCQDPYQYCANMVCASCQTSCSSGPGYPTCVNACMNNCMGHCVANPPP
jgi:hypothetical protein